MIRTAITVVLAAISAAGCAIYRPPEGSVWAYTGEHSKLPGIRLIGLAKDEPNCRLLLANDRRIARQVVYAAFPECRPATTGDGGQYWVFTLFRRDIRNDPSIRFGLGAETQDDCESLRQLTSFPWPGNACVPLAIRITPCVASAPCYSGYLDVIRQMIKEKWAYPCVKDATTDQCEYKSAKLVIVIDITKDGRVSEVEVAERSGDEIYDAYAVNAVKAASPFPPVPVELMAMQKPGSTSIRITTAFRYIVETTPKRGKP